MRARGHRFRWKSVVPSKLNYIYLNILSISVRIIIKEICYMYCVLIERLNVVIRR